MSAYTSLKTCEPPTTSHKKKKQHKKNRWRCIFIIIFFCFLCGTRSSVTESRLGIILRAPPVHHFTATPFSLPNNRRVNVSRRRLDFPACQLETCRWTQHSLVVKVEGKAKKEKKKMYRKNKLMTKMGRQNPQVTMQSFINSFCAVHEIPKSEGKKKRQIFIIFGWTLTWRWHRFTSAKYDLVIPEGQCLDVSTQVLYQRSIISNGLQTALGLRERVCSLSHAHGLCASALVVLVNITTLCGQSSIDCAGEEQLSGRRKCWSNLRTGHRGWSTQIPDLVEQNNKNNIIRCRLCFLFFFHFLFLKSFLNEPNNHLAHSAAIWSVYGMFTTSAFCLLDQLTHFCWRLLLRYLEEMYSYKKEQKLVLSMKYAFR